MYVAEVESFTHKCKNQVIVAKKFLNENDRVLIIDDFLANGCALQGLIQIVKSAGATVEGIGIAVEKGFQAGGRIIGRSGDFSGKTIHGELSVYVLGRNAAEDQSCYGTCGGSGFADCR